VYEPVTGHLLDQGNTDYRPNAPPARLIPARDRHCQFPGSGNTSAANLAALCPTPRTGGKLTATTNSDGTLANRPDSER
jgi:hypothetical protein